MSVPRYDSYRNSGVEWLGEVPSHWAVMRLKLLCDIRPSNVDKKAHEGEEAVRLCNYTDVYYNEKITADLDLMEATASLDQIGRFQLMADDVIITKDSETADDIAIAAYVPEDMPGVVCGYHLALLRPSRGTSGKFLKRYFDSVFAKSCFAVRANGLTRVGLSQYSLSNVEVPLPPPSEQAAIAAFLDRETAKIDALVEEQRRLIALLAEKRQAVISHAVTKGLDPTVPMKESGVEWLGEVPAHWGATSLKRSWTVTDCKHLTADFIPNGIPLASIREVQARFVQLADAKRTSEDFFAQLIEGGRKPQPGDLIFSRNATVGEVAEVADWHPDFAMGQDVCMLRRRSPNSSSAYLYHVLKSDVVYEQLYLAMVGSTFKRVNVEEIRNLMIPVPPALEQVAIAHFLEKQAQAFDALTAEAQAAITLLQERRAALISAAVTGNIDVRGLVPAVEEAA